MKIYGTAKGGAISKKDFGVAFGGNGGSECSVDLRAGVGFSVNTDTNTATATNAENSNSYAWDENTIEVSAYLKYYLNDVLKYTSENVNSGTLYPKMNTWAYEPASVFGGNVCGQYSWTVKNAYDWYAYNGGGNTTWVGFGFNNSSGEWGAMAGEWKAVAESGVKKIIIFESGSNKFSENYTIQDDDVFKITYE